MTSTSICRFLNEQDISIKSCVVMYGQCGRELKQTTRGNSTVEDPNTVSLPVDSGSLNCYVATASSGSFTIIVEAKREEKGIYYTCM